MNFLSIIYTFLHFGVPAMLDAVWVEGGRRGFDKKLRSVALFLVIIWLKDKIVTI